MEISVSNLFLITLVSFLYGYWFGAGILDDTDDIGEFYEFLKNRKKGNK